MVGRVLIVLDGAPDAVGTLAAARTPALDALCRRGSVSLLRTTPPGLDPGSETGIPTLLGAPPTQPLGRGWIEAAAAGVEVPAGSTPWRIDLRRIDGRRVEAAPLRDAIAARLPRHDLFALRGHRLLAVGPERPRFEADPAASTRTGPLPPVEATIWPDGALPAPVLNGDTVMICGPGAAAGCARLLGLDVCVPPGATGDVDTDLAAKAAAAEEALAAGRDVVIHVGALDEASHRRDPGAKRSALERVDAQLVAPLSHQTLAVTADHSTCPLTGRHGAEPVPLVVAGPDLEPRGPDSLADAAQAVDVHEHPRQAPSGQGAVEVLDHPWHALRVEAAA